MKKYLLNFCLALVISNVAAQENNLGDFYTYFIDNKYDSAKAVLERKIQSDGKNARLSILLGKTYLALRDYPGAVREFNYVMKNQEADAELLSYLAQAYEEQGMLAEAIDAYKSALKLSGNDNRLRLKLAALYDKQRNYNAAVNMLRQCLAADSTSLQAYYQMGRAFLKTERYDSTIYFASRAVALDSAHFPNVLNLGMAWFHANKMKPAQRYLETAARLSPSSDAAKYFLGQTYAKQDRIAEGILQLEESVILTGPYRLRAQKLLVQFYHRTERYLDCVNLAEKYIEEKKDDPLIHHYLARALSDLCRFDESDNSFKKTLFYSNEEFIKMTYFYRGLNYYHQENFSQAIKLYQKARTMDPEFSFVYYNLAIAYDQYYADKNLARDYYRRFISLTDEHGGNPLLVQYAKTRLSELNEKEFFNEGKSEASSNE